MSHVTFPFECPTPPPHLPRNPQDGDTVCDSYGNIFRYQAAEDAWIFRGVLKVPPLVTESDDGIVPVNVFDRIQSYKSLTNNGRNFPPELKILPHTDSYWYYLDSSDKLFRFLPEGQNKLRIEIDRARLFTYLARQSQRGPKGSTGDKGETGLPGNFNPLSLLSAHCQPPPCVDKCLNPTSVSPDGRIMKFEATVETPLDTNISLRLTVNETTSPSVTVLIPPAGGEISVTIADPNLKLDIQNTKNSISYNRQTKKLVGSFILEDGVWSIFCILVRQKGPTGDKGDDAACFKPKQCLVAESNIRFTNPIIAVRRDCNQDQFLVTTANLFGVVCVDKLRFELGSPDADFLASGSIVKGRLLALKPTLDSCKDLLSHKPDLRTIEMPKLELPEWRPQPDCQNSRHFDSYSFDWMPMAPKPFPFNIMGPQRPQPGVCDPCDNPPRLPGTTTICPPPSPTPPTPAPIPPTTLPPEETTTSTTTAASTTTESPTATTTTVSPVTTSTTTTTPCPQLYSSGFEPPTYIGSPASTPLNGVDGWIDVSGAWGIFTYVGNAFGFSINPTGAVQFIAADQAGNFSFVTSHAVAFGIGGVWSVSFDMSMRYFGSGTTVFGQIIGAVALEPFGTARAFAAVLRWLSVTPTVLAMTITRFDVLGTPIASLPGPAWNNLLINSWYRHRIVIDFNSNRILSVEITDIASSITSSFSPPDWYLRGGAAPVGGFPIATSFAVGGPTQDFVYVGFDNADFNCGL